MRNSCFQVLLVAALLASWAEAQQNGAVLDSIPQASINLSKVSLRQALSEIDTQLLEPDYVIFGVELVPSEIGEPVVDLKTARGETVRDMLAQIMHQAPGYDYSAAGPHLINVYPVQWRSDPRNLMNVEVAKVDLKDRDVEDLLHIPWSFIPEIHERFFRVVPGQPATFVGEMMRAARSPKLSLKMEKATLREVFNQAAEVTSESPPPWSRVGWLYEFRPQQTDPFRKNTWTDVPSAKGRSQR
jgi:hypothetical protein